jgi:hypothetical protein
MSAHHFTIDNPLGIDIFKTNSCEVDPEKIERLNLSDKQRQNALKLSEKMKRLEALQEQLSKVGLNHESSSSVHGDLDTAAFEDTKTSRPKHRSRDATKLAQQISELEDEIEEISDNIAHTLGYGDDTSKRRRISDSRFEHDILNDESDEFFDAVRIESTKLAVPLMHSENITTVESKLNQLYEQRSACEAEMAEKAKKKEENQAAANDDDIDPLDAFMATTTAELVDEDSERLKSKLALIQSQIDEYENLFTILSKNQFNDVNIQAALEQRDVMVSTSTKPLITKSSPRGSGSVWEDEFKKDDSVPDRIKVQSKTTNQSTVGVRLDSARPGLQLPGQQPVPVRQSESATWRPPPDDKNQDQLRKKLGY